MKKINKYIANLTVWNAKLHNLHWNVTGKSFMPVHEFTEGLYNEVFTQYDDVAESLKMKNEFPVVKLADCLKLATIQELDSKDYSDSEVLKIVEKDMIMMQDLAKEIREEADKKGDFSTVAMFEEYVASYAKNLWFLRAMNK